jgi:hypothetical protein
MAIRAGLNEVQLQAATNRLISAGGLTCRRSENEQVRKHAGRMRGEVGRGPLGVLWGLRFDPRLPNSFDPDHLGPLTWGAWGCSYFKAQDEY